MIINKKFKNQVTQFGPMGINCPCCRPDSKLNTKKLTNRKIRQVLKSLD